MAADTVFVRTLSGDLLLGANVSSTSGTDLVAASRFQNTGGYTIAGAPWRVWADTWVGETRGGLAGSGLYPNLYHCAYSGLCAVSIPAGANHFIYAQQPVATVIIANASRPFGYPNPLFSYGIGGLILGDTGAGFAGFLFSPALQASPQGAYPINGTFTSAEGYAVNVVPGTLFVGGLPNLPRPDVFARPARHLGVRPQHRPAADLLRHRAAGRRPRNAGQRRAGARMVARALAAQPVELRGHRKAQRLRRLLTDPRPVQATPRARRLDITTLSFGMTWPSRIAEIHASVEVTAAKLLWKTTLKTRWISSAVTLPAAFSYGSAPLASARNSTFSPRCMASNTVEASQFCVM